MRDDDPSKASAHPLPDPPPINYSCRTPPPPPLPEFLYPPLKIVAKILGQGGKIMRLDLEPRYQEFGRNNLAILILGMILVKIVHKIFSLGWNDPAVRLAKRAAERKRYRRGHRTTTTTQRYVMACCIALALKSYRKMCMQHVYSTHVRKGSAQNHSLHMYSMHGDPTVVYSTCSFSFVTCLLNIGVSSLKRLPYLMYYCCNCV